MSEKKKKQIKFKLLGLDWTSCVVFCRLNMEPEPCRQTKTTDEQRLKNTREQNIFLEAPVKKRKEKSIFSMHLDSFGIHRLKDIKRRKNCLGMLPFFLLELVRVCVTVTVSASSPALLLLRHIPAALGRSRERLGKVLMNTN